MTRQTLLLVFVFTTLVTSFTHAQNSRPHMTFEVATVKPSAPLDMTKIMADAKNGIMPRMGQHLSPGRAEYSYMALSDLIEIAYDIKANQVQGPAWITTLHFDIVAKLPEGSSKEDIPAMLQQLLTERFKLTAHHDAKEQRAYALVVYKNPPNLKAADATYVVGDQASEKGQSVADDAEKQTRVITSPDGTLTIDMGKKGIIKEKLNMTTQTMLFQTSSITMAGFAGLLTYAIQTSGGPQWQVVDETGLTGRYQLEFEVSLSNLMSGAHPSGISALASDTGEFGSDPNGGSTVFASVERLGLKLQPRKVRLDQLVVDSIEQVPTEN